MIEAAFFYLFSALAVGGGILMITRRSVVVSAVWLIASLLGVAGLFLLLGAEFLFVAQLVLYVGGVVLLFLIALMLMNFDDSMQVRRFRAGWPAVLCAAAGLAIELIALLARGGAPPAVAEHSTLPNTEAIAEVLFSRYLVAFELSSVVLLAAITGAVVMGRKREA